MQSFGINYRTIKLLFGELLEKKIIKRIGISRQFPDDPKIHNYGAQLVSSQKYSDGKPYLGEAYGFSSVSTQKALFKCLTESIERFYQLCYRESQIIYSSFNDLKEPALDPYLYISKKSVTDKKIGWVIGKNVTKNTSCLIPAQLVFLNYRRENDEILLQDANTTGAAGGFDYESTLTRAIYEAVERDAFMNTFLGRFPAKRINPHLIKNNSLLKLLKTIKRYNFEINLFDITTNIQIPSYLAILIDYTGLGPALGFGTKTSFDQQEAIIGCIEESLQSRPWLRRDLLMKKNISINPLKINNLKQRGMYWSNLNMIKNFDFLFKQKPGNYKITGKTPLDPLTAALMALRNEGYDVYLGDVTVPNLLPFQYFVYKAVIPGLQPLPLDETIKQTNIQRLSEVAKFYNVVISKPNNVPQPIL